jgi:hypothetical protein
MEPSHGAHILIGRRWYPRQQNYVRHACGWIQPRSIFTPGPGVHCGHQTVRAMTTAWCFGCPSTRRARKPRARGLLDSGAWFNRCYRSTDPCDSGLVGKDTLHKATVIGSLRKNSLGCVPPQVYVRLPRLPQKSFHVLVLASSPANSR